MPEAPAPVMSISLLLLAFFVGVALAALIFWPLLRRAQQHPAARLDRSSLRSARNKALPPGPTTDPIMTEPAVPSGMVDEEAIAAELGPMPDIPADLFVQHHAAQFARTRARIERLRTQVNNL